MDMDGYLDLCREASLELELDDIEALGMNETIVIDGVPMESLYREGFSGVLLLAEMGAPADDDKAGVYEQLLLLQLLHWSERELRFGFHPARETIVLTLMFTLGDGATPDKFAELIRVTAAQVVDWKRNLLPGRLFAGEGDSNPMAAFAAMGAGHFDSAKA